MNDTDTEIGHIYIIDIQNISPVNIGRAQGLTQSGPRLASKNKARPEPWNKNKSLHLDTFILEPFEEYYH